MLYCKNEKTPRVGVKSIGNMDEMPIWVDMPMLTPFHLQVRIVRLTNVELNADFLIYVNYNAAELPQPFDVVKFWRFVLPDKAPPFLQCFNTNGFILSILGHFRQYRYLHSRIHYITG